MQINRRYCSLKYDLITNCDQKPPPPPQPHPTYSSSKCPIFYGPPLATPSTIPLHHSNALPSNRLLTPPQNFIPPIMILVSLFTWFIWCRTHDSNSVDLLHSFSVNTTRECFIFYPIQEIRLRYFSLPVSAVPNTRKKSRYQLEHNTRGRYPRTRITRHSYVHGCHLTK